MKYNNGDIYEGEWKKGFRNGNGVIIFFQKKFSEIKIYLFENN